MVGRFELIELTGWLGVILLCLCLAKLSNKQKTDNQHMSYIRKKHKYFGWAALTVLFIHGNLATSGLLLPVMGHGRHFAISEDTGWGSLVNVIRYLCCFSYSTLQNISTKASANGICLRGIVANSY